MTDPKGLITVELTQWLCQGLATEILQMPKKPPTKKPSPKKKSAEKKGTKPSATKKPKGSKHTRKRSVRKTQSKKKQAQKTRIKLWHKAICFVLACLALYSMLVYYPQRHRQAILERLLNNIPNYYQILYGKALSPTLQRDIKQIRFSTEALKHYHDYFDNGDPSQPGDSTVPQSDNDKLAQQYYASRRAYLSTHPTSKTSSSTPVPLDTTINYPVLLKHYQNNLPLATIRAKHKQLAPTINTTPVPKSIVLAILGCETAWGNLVGRYPMNFKIISALATLASAAPTAKKRFFYLDNLLAYLHILMEHIPPNTVSPNVLKESTFDGGMGIPQFEPINYVRYAKDGDNQNPVNIWESIPDASASVANYLQQHGWQQGLRWGYFVYTKPNNPTLIKLAKARHYQSIQAWQSLGITLPHHNQTLPYAMTQTKVRLLLPNPAAQNKAAFLVTKNYDVLMRWNPSESEAIMIGIIANIMEDTSLDYNSFM